MRPSGDGGSRVAGLGQHHVPAGRRRNHQLRGRTAPARLREPEVAAPVPLREALQPPTVLLYERANGARLGSLIPPDALVIGPEGGFSPAEVTAAEAAGCTVAGLGPRILRSESVALAAAAVVLSRSGDFA